jgi:hypothetical protein
MQKLCILILAVHGNVSSVGLVQSCQLLSGMNPLRELKSLKQKLEGKFFDLETLSSIAHDGDKAGSRKFSNLLQRVYEYAHVLTSKHCEDLTSDTILSTI